MRVRATVMSPSGSSRMSSSTGMLKVRAVAPMGRVRVLGPVSPATAWLPLSLTLRATVKAAPVGAWSAVMMNTA